MAKTNGLQVAIAGMLVLAVAMGVGRFAFTPILPMMQEDAGLTVVAGGWLASSNYLGYLLGALLATVVRARVVTALRTGLLAVAALTMAMGYTTNIYLWTILRLLAGVASAWLFIAVSIRCLGMLAPYRRPVLNGLVYSGVGLGIAVTGLLCILLMHAGAGSAWAWIAAGVLVLAAAVFALPVLCAKESEESAGLAIRGHVGSNEQMLLVLCYGSAGFGYIVPATFLPAMARAVVGDVAQFGWSWPAFGVAAFVSTLIAARRAMTVGNRTVWIAGQSVMAVGVLLPALAANLFTILVSALLVGGTFMVVTMTGMQEARAVGGRGTAQLTAAMTAAFALGQITGAVVASMLIDLGFGFSGGFLLSGAMLGISCALLQAGSRMVFPVNTNRRDA